MTTEKTMNIHERRKYLRIMQDRYFPADRAGRGLLLDEMEAMTGLDRKTLIRLLPASPLPGNWSYPLIRYPSADKPAAAPAPLAVRHHALGISKQARACYRLSESPHRKRWGF